MKTGRVGAGLGAGKAQAQIEFIGGFFLFLIVVMYTAFSMINSLPQYYEDLKESNLNLEAWKISERFLLSAASDGAIDDAKLSVFEDCVEYDHNNPASIQNYSLVKSALGVGDSNDFHITVEQLPLALLEEGDNAMRNGTIDIDGQKYAIYARNTSSDFNETRKQGGAWTEAGSGMDFNGVNYTVTYIDSKGEFVVFKKIIINCGP